MIEDFDRPESTTTQATVLIFRALRFETKCSSLEPRRFVAPIVLMEALHFSNCHLTKFGQNMRGCRYFFHKGSEFGLQHPNANSPSSAKVRKVESLN
jgi:hypothetical protein